MRKQAGFNLIELLVVIAIIGILGSVGYSSYSGYVIEARRGEALSALLAVAHAQEKFFMDNNRYAPTRNGLAGSNFTNFEHYDIGMQLINDDTGYLLLAQPKSGSPQAADTPCPGIRLYSDGRRTPSECWE